MQTLFPGALENAPESARHHDLEHIATRANAGSHGVPEDYEARLRCRPAGGDGDDVDDDDDDDGGSNSGQGSRGGGGGGNKRGSELGRRDKGTEGVEDKEDASDG
jgi:hypothetical protein